jgi:hypothetical protein
MAPSRSRRDWPYPSSSFAPQYFTIGSYLDVALRAAIPVLPHVDRAGVFPSKRGIQKGEAIIVLALYGG